MGEINDLGRRPVTESLRLRLPARQERRTLTAAEVESGADRVVCAAMDWDWRRADAVVTWMPDDVRSLQAVSDPRLLELPSRVAGEAVLRLLTLFGAADAAAFWSGGASGRTARAIAVGPPIGKRERALVGRVIETATARAEAHLLGLPVLCWGACHGGVVLSARETSAGSQALFRAAARALAAVVQRDLVLSRSAERERILTEVAERRLLRTGLDLHDGPVQTLAAVSADLSLFGRQIGSLVHDERSVELARGRIDDLRAQLAQLGTELRSVARFLESTSGADESLGDALRACADLTSRRLNIPIDVTLSGDFTGLTDSQRIAITRIVQESLSNVAEHSCATSAEITVKNQAAVTTLEITDNGNGFDVDRAVVRAAKNGRLGLVGMNERARLLGGTLSVTSSIGSSTTVRLVLPEWRPLEARLASEPVFGAKVARTTTALRDD